MDATGTARENHHTPPPIRSSRRAPMSTLGRTVITVFGSW
jgi:hypothetical protein